MPLLKVKNVATAYGKVEALKRIAMCVEQEKSWRSSSRTRGHYGRIISGSIRPRSGTLRFLAQPLDRFSLEAIVKLGVPHVPETPPHVPGHSRQREYSPLWFESNPGSSRGAVARPCSPHRPADFFRLSLESVGTGTSVLPEEQNPHMSFSIGDRGLRT
jgi:hypothetical protein